MYYGEGAGNRRKLIKAKVEERSKDPAYKVEFERQLSRQNMASHASKARAERTARDTGKNVRKAVRTARNVMGVAVSVVGLYRFARDSGAVDAVKNMLPQKVDYVATPHTVNRGRQVTEKLRDYEYRSRGDYRQTL